MAGTYLQQDFYGEIVNAAPAFNAATMTDHQLVELVRSVPAVQHARKHCDWVVVTALYQPKLQGLNAPITNASECWLAFVDREEHSTPGWTKIPLVLFSSYERNENIFKVMLPAAMPQQPLVVLNHALPQARCLGLAHLIRGKELARGAPGQPHLLASKIPGWSGRAFLPGQLEMTKGYLWRRNATRDMAEYTEQVARMESSGFNASEPSRARLPITDTLWMIWPSWPGGDMIAEKMSRLWLHEVARYSSFEKVAYAWIVSQLPTFKAYLTDAIYIYSPTQKCGWTPGMDTNKGNSSKKKRTKKRRGMMMKLRRRLGGEAQSEKPREQ